MKADILDWLWSQKKWIPPTIRARLRPYIKFRPIDQRYGFDIPPAAIVSVGDQLSVRDRGDLNPAKGSAYDLLLFWTDRHRHSDRKLVNTVASSKYLPKRIMRTVIEDNRQEIYVSDMYSLIHRRVDRLSASRLASLRVLIVAVNPQHPLPILARMVWRDAKVLCLFEEGIHLGTDMLRKADGVMAPSAVLRSLSDGGYPLLIKAESPDDVIAHIKAYIQVSGDRGEFYFFSINGRSYRDTGIGLSEGVDLVFVGADEVFANASKFRVFGEFVEHLVTQSQDVLVHSKWLYPLETFVAKKDWVNLAHHILARGGRIRVVKHL